MAKSKDDQSGALKIVSKEAIKKCFFYYLWAGYKKRGEELEVGRVQKDLGNQMVKQDLL